ncbi:PE-PPE domain-containing protein [Mycolicibacterium pulveris]|uniref:PE-PPE domain-containing protein n=1 Tax=Mycolicibacterium pulveris TaxID=36813 RepID=UPI003CF0B63B
MRVALRAAMAVLPALVVATIVVLIATMTFAFVALASTTVLIMGGTGHPLSTPPDTVPYVRQYMSEAVTNFISPASTASAPTGIPQGPYNGVAVITPEEDWPNYGSLTVAESVTQGLAALHGCLTSSICHYNQGIGSEAPLLSDAFVVFGYSQSATIAMLEKRRLAAEYAEGEGPDVSFVTIGGPRPNGGLAARDTTGIVTYLLFGRRYDELTTQLAPTDTQYSTVDIALQYDGFSDFPLNPLNLLASLNAYMGIIFLHTTYGGHSLSGPGVLDQGQYGDTHYYLISTDVLPLLKPVQNIPIIGHALADSWDPVLRVIIESAYDRSASPGAPTPFDIFYFENPIRLTRNIIAAIPVGMDNGIESLFGFRPLGTRRPGAFGVGGPRMDPVVADLDVAGAEGATSTPHLPADIEIESVDSVADSISTDLSADSEGAADFGPLDGGSVVVRSSAESTEDVEAETSDPPADAVSIDASTGSENSAEADPAALDDAEPGDSDSTTTSTGPRSNSTGDPNSSPADDSSIESPHNSLGVVRRGDRATRADAASQARPRMVMSASS